ncbi:MarR family transcriptional regulator [uncultured Paraglaciecola sp.]|uniref:MarR family winged helix-turn-helix transcriptional regulator n=1 Tax=uncultured Paraglaciecola sp. TaxID=1765024 RepID=UPI0025987B28|nr:MarR family transcriptional regulator [uncultured Paraglaciecola sp.]
MNDSVDLILQQWKNTKPELNCSAMGIVGRLFRIESSWKKQLETVFKQHKLSGIEFDILATLYRSQIPLTPTELYQTLMLSSGAMSTRIEALVQRQLIERISSVKDRRSCKITLTEEGKTIIDTAVTAHVANMEVLLRPLKQMERIQLTSLLKKIVLADKL